jgi:hypothetical protein
MRFRRRAALYKGKIKGPNNLVKPVSDNAGWYAERERRALVNAAVSLIPRLRRGPLG